MRMLEPSKNMPGTKLLSLEESLSLDIASADELYAEHLNPALLKLYRALGLTGMDVESAEGVEIHLRGGRRLLDFSGGMGMLALGHNHPRILAAERLCQDRKVIDALKVAPHRLQGALAYNLAQVLPGGLNTAFFAVSGAEAVEAALKICEKAQGPSRTRFISMTGAFHGKTHGALAVTSAEGFRRGFLMGIPKENVIEVPYGDRTALEETLTRTGETVIAVILEPVTGEGVFEPPEGYLCAVQDVCRARGVLTIFDEVKAGMGRTGTFCSFQREEVVPDVVTLSKALGGGKRAIAAMVSTRELFDRAYGNRNDCALHTSTFGGLGGSCAVAIETLNVLQEERLVERCRARGEYLRRRLEALREKYPGKIIELRGRGLFQGVRFDLGQTAIGNVFDPERLGIFKTVQSAFMASIIRELFTRYGILVHFAPSSPDVLHLMPPLVVEEKHLDVFVEALDDLLERGLARVAAAFVKGNLLQGFRGRRQAVRGQPRG